MARQVSRRELLWGVGGGALGVPLGLYSYHNYATASMEWPPAAPAPLSTSTQAPPPVGDVSYAQSGEDIIVGYILRLLRVKNITYLDIGAYKPIFLNNTYYFYQKGLRGVLVEPNTALAESLRSVRPEDTTLVAGIGLTAEAEADYYLMSDPAWNTFSKEEAEHMQEATKGDVSIQKVVKMPLLDVNDVIAEYFGGEAPTFVSIDAEGLHEDILKKIDYDRFRPKVICIETLVSGTANTIPAIPAFMKKVGYVICGSTFVNSIFVDAKLFSLPT